MIAIGKLNDDLIQRTSKLLQDLGREQVGGCRYNLTLINRCYPDGEVVKLKDEPTFGKDHCTVSWHADSTLEHYSSIAVYHCTKPSATTTSKKQQQNGAGSEDKKEKQWRVALRVCHNAEGPLMGKAALIPANKASITSAPALAVPLPSKAVYYLLDDFNHHHQHSVLAGSTDRFASTHRVCRTEGHTFASIQSRCTRVLQGNGTSAKQVRAEQSALNEIEFEWIRQMYIQGELHHELHSWWHGPMKELLDLWAKLTERIEAHLCVLKDATGGIENAETTIMATLPEQGRRKLRKQLLKRRKRCELVDAESFDALIEGLEERHTKRDGWHAREKDPAFQSVSINCRPMPIPFPSVMINGHVAPHPDAPAGQTAMQGLIDEVRGLKEAFVKKPLAVGAGQQQKQKQPSTAISKPAVTAEGTEGALEQAVAGKMSDGTSKPQEKKKKKSKNKKKKRKGGEENGLQENGGKKKKVRF